MEDMRWEVLSWGVLRYFEVLVDSVSWSQIASAVICVYISEADSFPLRDISLCRG